jgi:cytochrome P450
MACLAEGPQAVTTQLVSEAWFDLQEPDLYRDPHDLLREMRERAPVYYSPELDSWVITRYDDVGMALRDPRFHAVEENKKIDALPEPVRRELAPMRRIFTQWGGRDDPPAHEEFLRAMKKHFTPRRMMAQLPVIEEIMERLFSAAVARGGPVDVVNDLAHPLAMSVVCHILGIPRGDVDMDLMLGASNLISQLLEMGELDQLRRSQQGMLMMGDFLAPYVTAARRGEGSGLFAVMAGPDSRLPYSDDDVVSQGIMFTVVGYHTTANLMANGVQLLFDHPEQRRLLLERGPSAIPAAFDEMMRYHGPVSTIRRMALADIALRGMVIPRGATVMLALLAANRDPAVFDDPDEFLVGRTNATKQLGFTVGPYSCMGQALARIEGEVFFRTLLGRSPHMVPADPTPDWTVFRPLGKELKTLRVWPEGRG